MATVGVKGLNAMTESSVKTDQQLVTCAHSAVLLTCSHASVDNSHTVCLEQTRRQTYTSCENVYF